MTAVKDPDQKLVSRARHGNSLAFGELVEKYQDQILRLTYDYSADYETAKDLAQSIFLKVFMNISSFSGQARFSTWLYRVAVNTCLDHKRQTKKNVLRLFSLKKEDAGLIDKVPVTSDNRTERVDRQINALPENQRTALILRYYHDKNINEIAGIMECSPSTVRTHLSRGIEKLKKSLKTEK